MPRQARSAPGGYVYHVYNRANGKTRLFSKQADYLAFEKVLMEMVARNPTRVLGWCLMPDHWHLILWPKKEGDLSAFMRGLTLMHSQRWHAERASAGEGHVYQGRFKSFPIESGAPWLTVLRYIERNAVRAKKAKRPQDWRWSSLWARKNGPAELREVLSPGPIDVPGDWLKRVNTADVPAELDALRVAVRRSAPFGSPEWVKKTAKKLNLEWTLRPRGRPRKKPIAAVTKSKK